jgi:excisionase family DNA binding protein
MFYSIKEAAEKLNKTEEEIKQIVQEGKLREFRDGPNLLFKVEEVEALVSEASVLELEEAPEPEVPEPQSLEPEIPEIEELEAEPPEAEALEPEIPEIEELKAEPPEAEALEPEIPEIEELEAEPPEAEQIELDIPEDEIPSAEALEEEMLAPPEEAAGTSEILLAPETGAPVAPSELTDADTALTGEGISVLGETDADYEITDDTLAETAIPMGTAGTGPEMPLEEIEGDVNLDSFGSGSGLLDLSLQADDTSLGGILDEIYTDEVEGKEAALEEVGDSAAAIAPDAGEMLDEEAPMISQPAPEVSMALARPYMEAAPDMSSNTLGMLLFLPLLVVIYTIVVAVSGEKEVMPSILSGIQAFIWYIMGAAAVVSLLVAGVAFMAGGNGTAKVKKPKKPKAPKAPKVPKAKKEKKPKKEKPPKEPKPKKPKKEKKKKKKK